MEVFRITVLSLLLWMAYVPYTVTGKDQPRRIYAEVGTRITLTCPSGTNDVDDYRGWYRGEFSEEVSPTLDAKIYRRKKDTIDDGTVRPDMTLDESTFTMTLEVQDDITDNGFFTCETEKTPKTYDVTQVSIFLQPVVTISADPQPDVGVNVTVTCAIERLFPNITSNKFSMRWGDLNAQAEFSGTRNEDGTMKYTLEKTKNLTREDDGVTVECTVSPDTNFGEANTTSMVLNLATITTTPSGSGGSSVGATIGGVISGLAAFAIMLAISNSRII